MYQPRAFRILKLRPRANPVARLFLNHQGHAF